MTSIEKYPMSASVVPGHPAKAQQAATLESVIATLGTALSAMGDCSLDACPSLGDGLKQRLGALSASLRVDMPPEAVDRIEQALHEHLQLWGQRAARHYRERTSDVKMLLLALARAAESIGERDQRGVSQLSQVTARIHKIVTLDDISQIRALVEEGATELQSTIARMSTDSNAAVRELNASIESHREKLDEEEDLPSCDALTGLRNRRALEHLMEELIAAGSNFSVAMLDLESLKAVNDTYGHQVGDDVLKQFAGELRLACHTTDAIGRWGGVKFALLMNCDLNEASGRIKRLCEWVCGKYAVRKKGVVLKLQIDACVGYAQSRSKEPLGALMARVDAACESAKALNGGTGRGW